MYYKRISGAEIYLMRCTSCGNKIADTAKFCPHCGQPTPTANTNPTRDVGPENKPQSSPQTTSDLNLDQQAFINSAAWGPTLTWIYLLGNRSWLAAVATFILIFIPVVNLATFIVLIITERRMAWHANQDLGFNAFQAKQKSWDTAGKIFTLAFIVLIPLLSILSAIILIAINPAERIKEAQDTQTRSNITTIASAAEACYTHVANQSYSDCDSIDKLITAGFLRSEPEESEVIKFFLTNDNRNIAISAPLKARSASCKSNEQPYLVYRSIDGLTKEECVTSKRIIEQDIEDSTSQHGEGHVEEGNNEIDSQENASDEATTRAETTTLINKINKQRVSLPPADIENGEPTLVTVQDVTKLQDQEFFEKAQNGDKVLIYEQAKKAYLYRPSTNRVINVAPVSTGEY